jgi:Ca2+-binding EF-hand superfamily protein
VKHNVSLQEVEEIKMVFDYIDTNRDGLITLRELKDALHKCGLDGRTSIIQEMIERIDDNNSKKIEFDEFYRLMTESMVMGSNLEKFKNYFRHKMVRNLCFTNILFYQ